MPASPLRNSLQASRTRVRCLFAAVGVFCTTLLPAQKPPFTDALPEVSGGDPAKDRIALTETLQAHPEDAHAWYALGLLEGRLHDFAAAQEALRRSLALDPNSAETHYLLGLSMIANPRAGLDWKGAIEQFRAALRLRPAYGDAAAYLGAGLSATGDAQSAAAALQTAVRLAPDSASAEFNLGLALEPLGRESEAATAFRRAAALRSCFAGEVLGLHHRDLGRAGRGFGRVESSVALQS